MTIEVTEQDVEALLEVYDFEEVLDLNDLSVADALYLLVQNEDIELPEIKPVTVWDTTPSIDHKDEH